jgi:hypothetical protein
VPTRTPFGPSRSSSSATCALYGATTKTSRGDLRLLTARDVFVNPSALTGESMPVEKRAERQESAAGDPFELSNICFMGSSDACARKCTSIWLIGGSADWAWKARCPITRPSRRTATVVSGRATFSAICSSRWWSAALGVKPLQVHVRFQGLSGRRWHAGLESEKCQEQTFILLEITPQTRRADNASAGGTTRRP